MNNIIQPLKIISLALALSVGISYVSAWTTPTAAPPSGNASAPVNVSGVDQTKLGSFAAASFWDANDPLNFFVNPNGDSAIKSIYIKGVLNIASGAGVGKVLTSDASGNATWQTSNVAGAGKFAQWAGTTQSCTISHANSFYNTTHSATFDSAGRLTSICTGWYYGACCKSLSTADYQAADGAAVVYSFGDSGRYNNSNGCQSADYQVTTKLYLNFHNVPILAGITPSSWAGGDGITSCKVSGN